jgi:hypothetical protein
LNLDNTFVTNEGLGALTGLTRLKTLSLAGTAATPAGVDVLKRSLPDLQASVPDESP